MRAYPKLKRMPGNTWNVEDEHTAKMYAQALLEHESFCELDVCGPAGPVSSLLLSVCTGARPTTSLISLRLSITGEGRWLQRGDLHPLILANKNLEVITLRNVYTFREEWQGAFRSLRQNAALKRLSLEDQSFGEDQGFDIRAWKEMVTFVREGSTLEYLSIESSREYQHELCDLMDAVTTSRTLSHFRLFSFQIRSHESEALAVLIQKNTSLSSLDLWRLTGSHWEKIFGSLRYNNTLQKLATVELNYNFQLDDRTLSALVAALQMNSTLKEIGFSDVSYDDETFRWKREGKQETVYSDDASISTCSVSADQAGIPLYFVNESIGSWMKRISSVTQLTLKGFGPLDWKEFFVAIRYNITLQMLELCEIDTLDDEAFKELLGALQVNSTLTEIHLNDTNWESEGKDALIREALEQKARRENYMAAMRAALAEDQFCESNTGRLFLCGSEHAGKTQLRMALKQVARGRTCCSLTSSQKIKVPRRTHGIEIEVLDVNSLDISIWDLAGQDIFRALQDLLFPKLNLACIFFFIFSPFDRKSFSMKSNLSDQLLKEFFPWIRFIASNLKITGHVFPGVKVIISHIDKLKNPKMMQWAKDVVSNVRLQFIDILDIDIEVLGVNSKGGGKNIYHVLEYVQQTFHELLSKKLFKVPNLCLNIGRTLIRRGGYSKSKLNSELVISTSIFYNLCKDEGIFLKKKNNNIQDWELFTAVSQYLQDVGNIMQLGNSDLVIVNLNWLTFSFMGRLIGSAHKFDKPVMPTDRYTSENDGLVSHADFHRLLETLAVILRKEGFSTMDIEMLQKLMEEMDLCFSVGSESSNDHQQISQTPSRFFAPAVFAEEKHKRSAEGLRQLSPWKNMAEKSGSDNGKITFLGVRVQCRDQRRTLLTPAFFPRFQVYFRNLLISNRGIRMDQVICDYNMINIIFEGYEVYIENDGNQGNHIDVLVRSSNPHSQTFMFTQKNLVQEIQDFCASSKGCPRVALVVSVLRTDCVRNLTLSVHRDQYQAILVEDLKRKWKEYILNQDMKDNQMWEEGTFANYQYTWPSNPQANLEQKWEKARDLLTDEDYADVLRSVKATTEFLETKKDNLKCIEKKIEKNLEARSSVAESSCRQTREQNSTSQHSAPSAKVSFSHRRRLQKGMSDLMIGHDRTHFDIRNLEQKIGENHQQIREDIAGVESIVKSIQMDVKNVQCYQREILETMVSIYGKLD